MQTLEEILAAGQAALFQKRAAIDAIRQADQEMQALVRNAILTAAAQHYPVALNEYATVSYDTDSAYTAAVVIVIPEALPVKIFLRSQGIRDYYTEPSDWSLVDSTPVYFVSKQEARYYSINELPMLLAFAKEQWEPAPLAETRSYSPPRQTLYDQLRADLNIANGHFVEQRYEQGNSYVNVVIATALIDLAENYASSAAI